MPTPLYLNGFENRVYAVDTTGTSFWTEVLGTPAISEATIKRGAGSWSMKCAAPASTYQCSHRFTNPAQTRIAKRFYFYKSGNPSADVRITADTAVSGIVFYIVLKTNGTLQVQVTGGTGPSNGGFSAALANDQWYLVELTTDCSTTAYQARLWVDDSAVSGDATTTGAAAGSQTQSSIGVVSSVTLTTARNFFFDDLIFGIASSITDRFGPTDGIVGEVPDGDGTHSPNPPTAGRFKDVAGVDISGSNPAYDNLDAGDLTQTAERISQPVAASTEYLELTFGTITLSADAPVAVQGEVALNTDGTNAFSASTRMRNGTTETVLFTGDWSVAAGTKTYRRALVAVADQTELDDLRMRIGYGSSQPATPYWEGLMFEVDIGVASGPSTQYGALSAELTFGKAVAGQRKTFGQITSPFTIAISTAGVKPGNTFFGSIALPITFGKNVIGQRKTFGQLAVPIVFSKETVGQRQTFGQLAFPISFVKEIVGRKHTFGQLDVPILFGKEIVGSRETFGELAFPIIFSKSITANIHAFGELTLPVTFAAFVDGQVFTGPKTLYGRLDLPIIFDKQIVAQRETFGEISTSLLFNAISEGLLHAFGELSLPIDFEADIPSGHVGVHGQLELGLILSMDTNGVILLYGVILNDALNLYLGEQDISAVYLGELLIWP